MGVRLGTTYGDGFQLIRELARGTRARVFLASDGVDVEAVKIHGADHAAWADREYRIGRELEHPNLVRVTRRLEVGGEPSVTMPFLSGPRLSTWAASATRSERLDALDGLLVGLEAFHAHGFVHRDVKPENVICVGRRRPVLLDYDLATGPEGDAVRITAGTPAYLSPEQTVGGPVGPESDLYAVGVILYRWLTGELPFSGSPSEVVAAHRERDVAPPSTLDPELEPFDALLARMLAKAPEARFTRGTQVREALREVRRSSLPT